MHHKANVGPIDPHPEGIGCHCDISLSGDELVLGILSLLVSHPSVVGDALESPRMNSLSNLLHFFPGRTIDDPSLVLCENLFETAIFLRHLFNRRDRKAEVGSLESTDRFKRLPQFEHGANVFPHHWSCRRGQGHTLGPPEIFEGFSQPHVIGTKVVTPLAQAMSLIHRNHPDGDIAKGIHERPRSEPFRSDVNQLVSSVLHTVEPLLLLVPGEGGIDESHRDLPLGEGIDLILHERDERAHHERDTAPTQRRELVTKRLSPAGRHHHRTITSGQNFLDDLFLTVEEVLEAKNFAEFLPCFIDSCHRHHSNEHHRKCKKIRDFAWN